MQIYEYKCHECDQRYISTERGDRLERACQACANPGPLKRVFCVAIHKPVMAHWNPTVQKEVTSNKDFKDKLKQKGEEYTARTGIEVNYQPIDPSDVKHKVTDEGMEATNQERIRRGMKPIKV